ncbi:MAG TPA: hypothetical protein ENN38_07580 [Actinobacteria bacterium]|nr:hypothetical protein [Actinomycetota bacterium]
MKNMTKFKRNLKCFAICMLAIALGVICLFIAGCNSQKTSKTKVSVTEEANEGTVESIVIMEEVKLYPPVEVHEALMGKDGGTIAIALKDSKGSFLPFLLETIAQHDPRRIYIGEINFEKDYTLLGPSAFASQAYEGKGVVIVEIGGKEEKAILRILKDWLDENFSEEEQKRLAGGYQQEPPLSGREEKGYCVWLVVDELEGR